jgi:hypothetical protein
MREVSSDALVPAVAITSRSDIPPAVVSVRAIPERVDGSAVGAWVLAAKGPDGDLEAAAVAGGRSDGQTVGRSDGEESTPDRLTV